MKYEYEENEEIIDGLDAIEVANTPIDDIDSEKVNLILLLIDKSGSMIDEVTNMKDALARFKQSLIDSKEAENILVARCDFASNIDITGYKKITEFDTSYDAGGATVLYDAICTGTEKLIEYRKFLKDNGTIVKAVVAVFSDGEENGSISSFAEAKAAIDLLKKEEITTSFISFGPEAVKESSSLGFRNLLKTDDLKKAGVDAGSILRKAFDCLSKSLIESSKNIISSDDDDFFKM